MARETFTLSPKDVSRIQEMLRWFERVGRGLSMEQRRRSVYPGGKGSNIKWFKVVNASANPLICLEVIPQKYQTWGWEWTTVYSQTIKVYAFPNFKNDVGHYTANNIIPAVYSGGYWISLYTQPCAFETYEGLNE